jgi:hypothetical protein
MAKAVNWQSRNQHLNGKIPFRLKSSCGQLKAGFRGEQGIYPSYPLTAARDASNLKAFLLLIVRIGDAFSCRWLFSVCGGLSLHRAYSILPGWNREGMISHRTRSVLIPPGTAAPFPAVRPAAGQRSGTIYREANRRYSGRRHIPPHRPEEYSFCYRSCSTRVPVYASGGTADNSSPESDYG